MNRNKLISKVVGNLSNAVIHKVLEKAIDDQEIASKYEKELTTKPGDRPTIPGEDKSCRCAFAG
ncbi:MAG TPA: hypothetical protein VJC16_04960 [Candidatus Nanoarchaeia archaeon]|nr:hypothetical protein [Candidatus Nanoarchaeia archaeon]